MASNWTIFLCSSCGVQVEVVKSEKVGRRTANIAGYGWHFFLTWRFTSLWFSTSCPIPGSCSLKLLSMQWCFILFDNWFRKKMFRRPICTSILIEHWFSLFFGYRILSLQTCVQTIRNSKSIYKRYILLHFLYFIQVSKRIQYQ